MKDKLFMGFVAGVLTLLLVLWGGAAKADWSNKLDVSVGSYHLDRDAGYKEVNPGLFYTHYFANNNKQVYGYAGLYHNSIEATSLAVGLGKEWRVHNNVDLHLAGGIVTGYEYFDLPAVPQVSVGAEFYDRATIVFIPAPKIKDSVFALFINAGRW